MFACVGLDIDLCHINNHEHLSGNFTTAVFYSATVLIPCSHRLSSSVETSCCLLWCSF